MPFAIGESVRVKAWFPPGHNRTPFYARGRRGVVTGVIGAMPNAEDLAYGRTDRKDVPIYRVTFRRDELWPDAPSNRADTIVVDIYEHWLEASR